jgi:crossover junction endodeoxyribonuclease RuvC
MVILGIDPGSTVTGYAFLSTTNPNAVVPTDFKVLDAGALKVKGSLGPSQRISILHIGLHRLIEAYVPQIMVMEKAFYDKNVATAIRLGEVRGAYIAAAGRSQVAIEEVTPAEVKKLIAGNGRASKEEVAVSIKALMGFDRGGLPFDVTDAVAIALSYGMGGAAKWSSTKSVVKKRVAIEERLS